MKREVPLAIAFLAGVTIIISFFIPNPRIRQIESVFNDWYMIIAAFAIILGVGSLIDIHGNKIFRRVRGYGYSVVLLVSLFGTAIIGIFWGTDSGGFKFIHVHLFTAMASTMFSLLAFFIASAAFRAFRAKTKEATLLLVAAFIVMLGQVPIGAYISKFIPKATVWIMSVPNTAGQRAIMVGAALGMVSASLKILLGIERAYLGGEK